MKKRLRISNLVMTLLFLVSWNLSAQEYHIQQGFPSNGTPDGWAVKDVSYSSSSKNAANQVFTDQTYCAKMKTNAEDMISWLQLPKVNGASDLSFWCKVKSPAKTPTVKIQTSTDNGATWEDKVTNPEGLDLANGDDFQNVTVPLNIEGEVIIRIHVQTVEPGTSSAGTLTVDDIQLGKPAAAANDVLLSELKIGGAMIDGFDFNQTSYTAEISHAVDFTVSATPNNSKATVEISQVSDINGDEAERTATVVVTGEDGTSTATTTIVFTQTDYWFKDGFADGGALNGWVRNNTFLDTTPLESTPNTFPGVGALKFTGGHPGDANASAKQDAGYILSPKMLNVGTLSFSIVAEAVFADQAINVYIKKGSDSTLVKSLDWIALTTEWQMVEVEINETTDSIQIKIEAICDVDNDGTSRLWMDDFLVTYFDGSTNIQKSDFNAPAVKFYPNPVVDMLSVKLINNSYQQIDIYNLAGQRVMQSFISSTKTELNVKDLPGGIYVMSLTGESGTYNAKFVKK